MKIYVTIDATLEFNTSRAIVATEFIESAVEEYCTISHDGLADYLKKKAKVELIGTNVTNKEVTAE